MRFVQYERKVHVERLLKMWRTKEEEDVVSNTSYANRDHPPPNIQIGLACADYAFAEPLGHGAHTVGRAGGGVVRSRVAGRADLLKLPALKAGDVVG